MILVMAKLPEPGAVKTRIAQELGDDAAAALQTAMLHDTWRLAQAVRVAAATDRQPIDIRLVLGSENHPMPELHPAIAAMASGGRVWRQVTGDLGARQRAAFTTALRTASWSLVIGSDCPAMAAGSLQFGIDALRAGADAAVGPSRDGGYYLLGLHSCPETVFHNVTWSQCHVLDELSRNLANLGWRLAIGPLERDVDDVEDLRALAADLRDGRREAPATRAWLQQNYQVSRS